MICEDMPVVVLLFVVDSKGLVSGGESAAIPRLDDFCLLVAGFFIETKTGLAKRVEPGYLISTQIPDFKKFRAFYYYASLMLARQ